MKRYLILNADDFGSCHGANAAIETLFNHGFISSTTLMPPAPWALDAVHRVENNPSITVGLHITTTAEYANYKWGPLCKDALSLCDGDGFFHQSSCANLLSATAEDMKKEIYAQYHWMKNHGLTVSHVDSHMGTVYGLDGPSHLEPVFALCAENGLNFRLPYHPETYFPQIAPQIKEQVQAVFDNGKAMGIGMPQCLFSHRQPLEDNYDAFKSAYKHIVEKLPEGVSEILMHPCQDTPEVRAIIPGWEKRTWEYRLLMDDDFLKFIQLQNITLCSYNDAPFFD